MKLISLYFYNQIGTYISIVPEYVIKYLSQNKFKCNK